MLSVIIARWKNKNTWVLGAMNFKKFKIWNDEWSVDLKLTFSLKVNFPNTDYSTIIKRAWWLHVTCSFRTWIACSHGIMQGASEMTLSHWSTKDLGDKSCWLSTLFFVLTRWKSTVVATSTTWRHSCLLPDTLLLLYRVCRIFSWLFFATPYCLRHPKHEIRTKENSHFK